MACILQAKWGGSVKELFILLLLFTAMAEDIRLRKISNETVLVGFVIGILYLVAQSGLSGLFLRSARLAVVLLGAFLIYQCSVFGAGDLKLISVMSLYFDWGVYFEWLGYSMLFSGVVALFCLVAGERKVPLGAAFFGGMIITLVLH